jgi:hypothetical protein
MIEYVDGFSGEVVRRVPLEKVPQQLRTAPRRLDNGEVTEVPIVRVVRLPLDEENRLVPPDQAQRARIQEYDADGVMLRETLQLRES